MLVDESVVSYSLAIMFNRKRPRTFSLRISHRSTYDIGLNLKAETRLERFLSTEQAGQHSDDPPLDTLHYLQPTRELLHFVQKKPLTTIDPRHLHH